MAELSRIKSDQTNQLRDNQTRAMQDVRDYFSDMMLSTIEIVKVSSMERDKAEDASMASDKRMKGYKQMIDETKGPFDRATRKLKWLKGKIER